MKESDSLIGHERFGNKIISQVNRKRDLRGSRLPWWETDDRRVKLRRMFTRGIFMLPS